MQPRIQTTHPHSLYTIMEFSFCLFFVFLLGSGICSVRADEVETEDSTSSTNSRREDEDPVMVLASDNFTQTIESERVILVEFYAPWCGHCKNLAPEYKVAAKELLSHDPPIPLAKVDATSNEDLASKYEVTGYPTMKVFHNGVPYEYEGPRKADGIVSYMKREARPDWKPPAEHVIVLTQENFTEATQNSDLMLVEFYAPWCGHCKQLAPQYKKAAGMLHKLKPEIKLAIVDATANTDLAKQYDVTGYPTMKIFRRGEVSEYGGPRDAQGIASYMVKHSEPAVILLTSPKDLSLLLKEQTPVVLGYFENEESKEFKAYVRAADEGREDPLAFRYFTEQGMSKKYKIKLNSLAVFYPRVLQSKFEPSVKYYEGSLSVTPKELLDELKKLSRPLVGLRNRGNVPSLYATFPLIIGYISNEDGEDSLDYWRSKLAPLAKKYTDITFAISDEGEFKEELKALNLNDEMEDIFFVLWGNEKEKYTYSSDEVSTRDIERFINNYKSGKLKPYLRSQPKPDKQVGPVVTVVGSTFKEIVMDPTKDVFVEFYAPWCGHCKALAPKYKSLAKKYKDNDKLVIAKFDASANDAPADFEITGFPTLFFKAAGEGSKPFTYDGEREVKEMSEFLEENAVHALGGAGSKDEL